ncbi:uncharacterized protein C22orf15 homolog isoform 2-T2 [Rhynchonycteris naso]
MWSLDIPGNGGFRPHYSLPQIPLPGYWGEGISCLDGLAWQLPLPWRPTWKLEGPVSCCYSDPACRRKRRPRVLDNCNSPTPKIAKQKLGYQRPHLCLLFPAAMFITVMFGAGCWELVNPRCSLVTLTAHLRQRGQVPPDATIALLAEDGHLVTLSKDQAPSRGSSLLQERGTYILVKIINGEGGAPTRYESLLENLDDRCPKLAEELRWLSGLPTMGNSQRKRTGTRRGRKEQGPLSNNQRLNSLLSRTR